MTNLTTLTLLLICLTASCAVGQTPAIEQLRDLSLETAFAEGGTSQCIIAVPEQDSYSSMADHLATGVAAVSGAKPAVMAVSDITDEMMQANHVIALGVFANNSVVEKLYDRLLVSCDWSWPEGDDSYVIRTVHNPWQTGRNVIYLGSVTAAGCEAAVGRFVEILTENPDGTIGPIIEVSSAPAALTDDEMQEHLGRIDAETSSRTMDGHVDGAGSGLACGGIEHLPLDGIEHLPRRGIERLPRGRGGQLTPSLSMMISRTFPASAWPRVAFMIGPMRAPIAWTLPLWILATTSGLSAMA